MKKLLLILIFLPLALFGQDEDPCFSINDVFIQMETDNPSIIKNFVGGWNMFGYPCSHSIDLSDAFSSIVEKVIIVKDNSGNVYMPEFGFNGIGFLEGGEGYQIKMTNTEYGFSFCEHITWPNLEGCTDCEAGNFNQWANIDDGSCNYDSDGDGVPDSEEVVGCQDATACNYDELATDSGECSYADDGYDCEGNLLIYVGAEAHGGIVFYYDSIGDYGLVTALEDLEGTYQWGCYQENVDGADGLSIGTGYQNTLDIINQGCIAENGGITAAEAAIDFESEGFDNWFLPSIDELIEMHQALGSEGGPNYLSSSEYSNNSCFSVFFNNGNILNPLKEYNEIVRPIRAFGNWTMGCMDSLACNFNPEANMADGSCNYAEQGYDCDEYVCPEDPVFLNWLQHNYPSYLINSTCIDIESASSYSGPIIIGPDSTMQNIDGIQYFNTTYLEINGLSQLIEIPDISGLTNLETLAVGNNDVLTVLPDLSELTNLSTIGIGYNNSLESLPDLSELSNLTFLDINDNHSLTTLPDLSGLLNLDTLLIYNNSSLGCALGYPEQLSINDVWPPVCGEEFTYQVGDFAEGGIVFYVDSTGERGLVADIQDLNQDGEITWQIAMSSFIDNNSQGYNDWVVPNISQLEMMSNSIGYGATDMFHNIAEFAPLSYWSSTLQNSSNAFYLNFYLGPTWLSYSDTSTYGNVRLIRAFGNWTYGCMDSLACNYNPLANMADGSCEYAEFGYDCDGNTLSIYQVGDITEGGIVFYVDETGQHGLVAAMEDLEGLPWGCTGTSISGAYGQAIGTGLQNTLEIVAGCSETPIAASEALGYESEGYSDWYLPSFNELREMYNTIGNGGLEGNIGGFVDIWYRSSSEYGRFAAWSVRFGNGETRSGYKDYTARVRVIRSF